MLYKGHFGKKQTNKKPVLLILPPLRQKMSLLIIYFSAVKRVCLAAPGVGRSTWDLSSLTRDWTRRPALGARSRSHCATREVPLLF